MKQIRSVMLFLRSLVFIIGMCAFAIFFGVTGLMLAFSTSKLRYKYITLFSLLTIWWAKIICGIRYKIIGAKNIPKQAAIVLCNHQSAWETLFLQILLPKQSWVLKKQLLNIPFFGWGLKLLDPIAIDRKKSSSIKQLTEQGKKRLDDGNWVVLFPQGSRIPVGKSSKYSRSGAGLAIETGYPIVCIAHNAGLFWPKNGFLKYPGTINIIISQAFMPDKYDLHSLHKATVDFIEIKQQELIINP
jgi:1-acyl-sn-glycerol-3-phosphate acyltransferase